MTNKEIAKAWFAAIDSKDYNTLKTLMHPDHRFRNPLSPAAAGIDDHIGMMQMMSSAFSGEHVLQLVIEDKDHAVVHGKYVAKHTGEFNGIPPTGKPLEFSCTDIFEIVDGKVRREVLEMNPMSIMQQIGSAAAS